VRDGPQRERHRDRGVAVVPAGRDAARHDRHDRPAVCAPVAPARDHDPRRRVVRLGWPAELSVPSPVTVQPEPPTDRPGGRMAGHARARPGLLRLRR
jgi:hypothetical protein